MSPRRRLATEVRRAELLDAAAKLFASRPYDEVLMEQVAASAGVSRALLYQHFATKRDLFAAIYARAAQDLLAVTTLDRATPLMDQVAAGLDAHIDYFVDNRLTVLAANRDLAGDPIIQAIISDELGVLRDRLLDHLTVDATQRDVVASVLIAWLTFVRSLCVDWLLQPSCSRTELREICARTLEAALAATVATPPVATPPVATSAAAGTPTRPRRKRPS